ncbi:MAG TPA: PAS domain S-box protein [Alphaproteobacteria bacterium]|nr:PAS domain S-box protein [Alphaproteobacteria bacterium]
MAAVQDSAGPGFLAGGGALGALIADHDWSGTALGPIAAWPPSLRTALGLVLRSSVAMVLLWGEDGVMLYNDAYSAFAGSRHPRLLGSKVREGWPEVAAFNDNVMRVCLAGGTLSYKDQQLTLHRNGAAAPAWMDLDYSPVLDESGRPAGVLAIVIETTGRVRAGQRIQSERERLARMFAQAPGLIAMLSGPDHVFELANPAYLALTGHRELIGRTVRDALPELAGQGLIDLLDEVYRSGRPFIGTAVPTRLRRTPDGPLEERFFDFVYQPLTDEAGRVTGIFAEGQDVTERAEADARARESEARLKRRLQQLQGLAEAAVSVTRAPTIEATLDEITHAARRIIGAHQGVVSLTRGPDWSQAINTVALTEKYAAWRDYAVMPDGSGIYAWLCETNRPVRMTQAELEAHPRWRGFGRHAADHPPMRGWLAAPLIGRDGQNLGLIQLSDKADGSDFDEADEAMLVQLAQLASAAVEQSQTEAALRHSEAQLRLGLAAGRMVAWELDLATQTVTRSANADAIFGAGQRPEDFDARVPEPDREANQARLAAAVADPAQRYQSEFRYRHPDGTVLWLQNQGHVVRDAEGRPQRVHGIAIDITERKTAELALRESEARLRSVVLAAPFPIMLHAEDGEVLELSRKWTELTGYPRERLRTHFDWFRLAYPDDFERVCRLMAAEFEAEGEIPAGEVPVRAADGSTRIWDFYNVGLGRLPDGRRLQISAAADVTDRKAAEAALRDKAMEFEALAENVSQLAWMADPAGDIFWYNKRWYEYTGTTLETMRGWGWRDVHPPGEIDRIIAEVKANWARGEPWEATYLLRSAGGEYRPFLTRVEPIRDAAGEIVRWFGTNTDITEQRRAEAALAGLNATLEARVAERTAALARSERRFRAIFDTAFQLTGLATLDGTILVVNRAALDAVGATQEQVAGTKMWDAPWWAASPEEARRVREGVAQVAAGGFVRYESDLLLPAGRRIFDFSMKPVLDEHGAPAYLVAEGRDITDQKQAEAALRQAQKMEAVGQLTGGIAHDFNNLLGAVMGSLDLIRRRPADADRVRRFAEAGLQAAERGAKLTGQLLAFSRAQRIELRPVVAAELIAGMRDLLARTLGPQVRLRVRLEEGGASVRSDATQLEMAVLNLAINARDAMPAGGELTIATALRRIGDDGELRPGDYVELSVADTGTGMPPDVAARAFDPFFTTKGVGKGTGLGLSQVYGIARQAGGTARIESRPGAGTTVRVFLPRIEAEAPPDAEAAADAQAAAGAATILVVDDDPDIRRVLVDSLDMLGYRVVEAADGPSGLAALDSAPPDLLMVDFAMPGMNGAEVARAARARHPGLPIVFASGYADTAAIEAAAGPDAPVLRKPFRIDELQAVLAAALGAG